MPSPDTAALAERLRAGDKRALARAITLVESDDPAGWELVRELYPHTGKASVVGFTGAPGAGKSTLIGALTRLRRAQDRQVAVLSIDPSSPFTHGALLGDRIRLTEHFLDPGVFIRSMANRGALGGLSEAALQAALLMDAAGKQDVFLETVGVGQAEIDVIDHADTVVLILMPGSGDSIQALKAGIMEIPDVIVVNKADHPLTDTMVREVRGVLSLATGRAGAWRVPIVRTEAIRGKGCRAARRAHRPPGVHRAGGHAPRAARAQPAQRGPVDLRRPPAPRPRAPAAGRPVLRRAARGRRGPPAGSRERRHADPGGARDLAAAVHGTSPTPLVGLR
jgi:LAO/AO transport system kinase